MKATKLTDGGPAFPMPTGYVPSNGVHEWNTPKYGMTLRDYFAANALIGWRESMGTTYEQDAEIAYRMADPMLEARGLGAKGA